MSASAWSICPRCKRRQEAETARLKAAADAAYGVVPREEWQELDEKAHSAGAPFDDYEFREDYAIGGVEDGTVIVSYGGACMKCGLSLTFKHEHDFPSAELEKD